ncbi:MAG: DUF502 domain-containing protein [Pirellulales bacterium]
MSIERIRNHLAASFVAGIVAILPIVGLAATIVYFENSLAGLWLKKQGFYFFGLGIILVTVAVYLVGLTVSTFVGRWIWRRVDRLLEKLPVLGSLYQTLKQLLGYGEGPKGLFQRVVFVNWESADRCELGLVTKEASEETMGRVVVFIPSAPTPTTGRLVYIDPKQVQPSSMTASQAMQLLVSLGTIQVEH